MPLATAFQAFTVDVPIRETMPEEEDGFVVDCTKTIAADKKNHQIAMLVALQSGGYIGSV